MPNALVWLSGGEHCLFADSVLKSVWRFRFEPQSGDISERKVFADCGAYRGIPDGCALDREGCVWIAEFGGGCVRRYDLSGRVTGQISVPATQVTTCGFAGPALDKLVIITAKRLLDDEQRRQQPESGNVFVCEPPVPGATVWLADPVA